MARRAHDNTDKAAPTFAFFCRKGRHRSVASACFLAEFFSQCGWRVQMRHMMREYWRLETCGECTECRGIDDDMHNILMRPWTESQRVCMQQRREALVGLC